MSEDTQRTHEEGVSCASPGCSEVRAGGRFCETHSAIFARVREQLEREGSMRAGSERGYRARRESEDAIG